jgi:hypothetical protein
MKRQHHLCFLATFIFFLSFSSLAQKPNTALQLNDYMAGISDTLYQKGMEWGQTFKSALKAKDFPRLTPVRKSLESFIDRKLVDVITLKDISGSEKLRLAMLDLLFFELRMIKAGFVPFESLSKDYTDAELKDLSDQLTKAVADEKRYLDKITEAQKTYGTKNGFTIEGE